MSALTWHTPKAGEWAARNSDHRYAIAERPRHAEYEAFHIEALWAIPKSLGLAGSLSDAQAICQRHNDEPRPSAA